jgi:DNA end-binding protein Ku
MHARLSRGGVRFIVLTTEDFTAAALEKTRRIDILDFVEASAIDDRFFEKPYYLTPGKGGDVAYGLLREAIRQSGRIGIAKFIMREVQHLAGIEVVDEALANDWDPEKYTDDYRENLMRVIKAKMKGKPADLISEEPPRDAKVVDLMERLRQSLDASSGRGRARRRVVSSARPRTARAAAKRSARPRARAAQRRRA